MTKEAGPHELHNPVLRTGHVQLRVLDLDESLFFYTEVLGMAESGRDSHGRVYLRAWDEHAHSSVVLVPGKTAGLETLGFKLRDEHCLERIGHGLRDAGIPFQWVPAGEMLETGAQLRVGLPSGHTIELFALRSDADVQVIDPPIWKEAAERGVGVSHLDHAVLYGPAIQETADLFRSLLGFHVSERVLQADGAAAAAAICLSTSNKPADLMLVNHATAGRLHRVAFRLESAEQVLRAADAFSMNRTLIDVGPFRDAVGRRFSVQAFDPSGIRIEVFAGGYVRQPDAPPVTWTWKKVGAPMALRDQRTRDRLLPDVT